MLGIFFISCFLSAHFCADFFYNKYQTGGFTDMHMQLIKNPDESKKLMYQIARVVYAETSASSLPAVEAMVSMIYNASCIPGKSIAQIISDADMFESLKSDSPRHDALSVPPIARGFQMCLRVVARMLGGNLPDACCGATRFHHDSVLPDWARARGYILDIDNLLFYL